MFVFGLVNIGAKITLKLYQSETKIGANNPSQTRRFVIFTETASIKSGQNYSEILPIIPKGVCV